MTTGGRVTSASVGVECDVALEANVNRFFYHSTCICSKREWFDMKLDVKKCLAKAKWSMIYDGRQPRGRDVMEMDERILVSSRIFLNI